MRPLWLLAWMLAWRAGGLAFAVNLHFVIMVVVVVRPPWWLAWLLAWLLAGRLLVARSLCHCHALLAWLARPCLLCLLAVLCTGFRADPLWLTARSTAGLADPGALEPHC